MLYFSYAIDVLHQIARNNASLLIGRVQVEGVSLEIIGQYKQIIICISHLNQIDAFITFDHSIHLLSFQTN